MDAFAICRCSVVCVVRFVQSLQDSGQGVSKQSFYPRPRGIDRIGDKKVQESNRPEPSIFVVGHVSEGTLGAGRVAPMSSFWLWSEGSRP